MKIKTWFILIIAVTGMLTVLIQSSFYFIFQSWSVETTDSIIEAVADQTTKQIDRLYQDIDDVAFHISTDTFLQDYIYKNNTFERVKNSSMVLKEISSAIFANKAIKYAAVMENDDILLNEYRNSAAMDYLSVVDGITKDMVKEEWEYPAVKAYGYIDGSCFAYVNRIFSTDINVKTEDMYSIIILFQIEGIENYLQPMLNQNKFSLHIVDSDNRILASENPEEFGKTFVQEEYEKEFWIKASTIQTPEWKLLLSIPKTDILAKNQYFCIFMFISVAVNILVLTFMIKVLLRNISKSISDVENEITTICNGNWQRRIQYEHDNELGDMVKNFNILLDKYDDMTRKNSAMAEEIHRVQFLQLQAQLDQLQEKISPHFLYNSMEYIKGVALEHNVPEIADITYVLSQIFRYNLNGSKITTVEEDLSYALNYFNIINVRKKEPIRVKVDISRNIMEKQIIKMVFQPILENILKHGELSHEGVVEITGRIKEPDYIEIVVKDNGQGIEPQKLKELQQELEGGGERQNDDEQQHLGLLNIHTRLRLYYGSDCGIAVNSDYQHGTEIIVTIKYPRI